MYPQILQHLEGSWHDTTPGVHGGVGAWAGTEYDRNRRGEYGND